MDIGTLIASEQPLLCVEGVQHIFVSILGLTFPKHIEDPAATRQKYLVLRIPDCIYIQKLQGLYTVCSYGCAVDEFKPTMNPYLQDASTITYWIKNMVLSLRDDINMIKF